MHSDHLAAGADPFSIGDFRERRVEAVDVVGGGAGVTAKQLPSVLAHPAELNVVVVFFLHPFIPPVFLVFPFGLRELIPGLPLDPLLLLVAELQTEGGGVCEGEEGGQTGREGMRNGVKGKKGGVWSDIQERQGWGVGGVHCVRVHVCAWSHSGAREGVGGEGQEEEMGDGGGGETCGEE